MELGFAHGTLQPQQQAIIEVRRVVDALLVKDQRIGIGAELEQLLPINRVACQPRDLEPKHDADLAEAHRGDQFLEAITSHAICAGHSEILIDDVDTLGGPSRCHRSLAQCILSSRALAILAYLPRSGLADVKIGVACEMIGSNARITHGQPPWSDAE